VGPLAHRAGRGVPGIVAGYQLPEEFTSEAKELLDTLPRDLVAFEAQGQNVRPELVNKIFRELQPLSLAAKSTLDPSLFSDLRERLLRASNL